MEKTTKKRKKSKRLKKRIGLVVIGGLSLVLTVCLSVGATLAWFAGSTWASNDMYMGGPVYVEMAGRGAAGLSDSDTDGDAIWKGGAGTLDIVASGRTTGTVAGLKAGESEGGLLDTGNILLPGQKLLIYSQARVFSTLKTSTINNGQYPDNSSGSNNSNVSDGTAWYYDGSGRTQSATTSVLRAKFSINIEFDPSVGFNNFTDKAYVDGYPVQSRDYKGAIGTYKTYSVAEGTGVITGDGSFDVTSTTKDPSKDGYTASEVKYLNWEGALGATLYKVVRTRSENQGTEAAPVYTVVENTYGRRDAVANPTKTVHNSASATTTVDTGSEWVDGDSTEELWAMKHGDSKCIYKWKYVSESQYNASSYKMGAPFNGQFNTLGTASAAAKGSGNGYYGVWEVDDSGNKLESDAFYKARTTSYLKSYVEHYQDDYNRDLVLQIGSSLEQLENTLNNSFVKLVNQSSDNIIAGNTAGFSADEDGYIEYEGDDDDDTNGTPASWLYVDPKVGNDTNAADSATSVGGWWYLVSSDTGSVTTGTNAVNTVVDKVAGGSSTTTMGSDGRVVYNFNQTDFASKNTPDAAKTAYPDAENLNNTFTRAKSGLTGTDLSTQNTSIAAGSVLPADDVRILNAKLYEISPEIEDVLMGKNPVDNTQTQKVVSISFPFVNGNFELPGKELTNLFANAKISFQITFQALQAYFPFTHSIDGCGSGTALAGTGKALNIGNSIPIFNEAFDYLTYLDTADYRGN